MHRLKYSSTVTLIAELINSMSMNATDFTRNFQSSYFGVTGRFFKDHMNLDGRISDIVKGEALGLIQDDCWVPCVAPTIRSGTSMSGKCLVQGTAGVPVFRTFAGVPWSGMFDEEAFITIDTPSSRMCEDRDGVSWISIIPVRGTARGYNPRGSIIAPLASIARSSAGIGGIVSTNDGHVVWNMLNEQYTSIHEAHARLCDGSKLGYALSKYLACYIDIGEESIAINFKGNKVGIMQDADNILLNKDVSDVAIRYITKLYPTAYVKIIGGRSLW